MPPKRASETQRKDEEAKKQATDKCFNLLDTLTPIGSRASTSTASETSEVSLVKIDKLCEGSGDQAIGGRVTNRSFPRDFGGTKPGSVFSFDVTDDTGTVRVSVFKSSASNFDELLSVIEVNNVVELKHFRSGKKNPAFNTLAHALEIFWQISTTYDAYDDDAVYPALTFNFTPLADVNALLPGTFIDVVGVAAKVDELQEIASGVIRTVTLVDSAGSRLEITLWNDAARNLNMQQSTVVAVKAARVKSYLGLNSLNIDQDTLFWQNPNIPEAQRLTQWMIAALKK